MGLAYCGVLGLFNLRSAGLSLVLRTTASEAQFVAGLADLFINSCSKET